MKDVHTNISGNTCNTWYIHVKSVVSLDLKWNPPPLQWNPVETLYMHNTSQQSAYQTTLYMFHNTCPLYNLRWITVNSGYSVHSRLTSKWITLVLGKVTGRSPLRRYLRIWLYFVCSVQMILLPQRCHYYEQQNLLAYDKSIGYSFAIATVFPRKYMYTSSCCVRIS